ncbi:MAG: nucleotidyltransferase domain-containing protein [Nitrospirales bacterium]|nr:nucleotidyltransferase domain-containing protein [Nitrospirales bacterium]
MSIDVLIEHVRQAVPDLIALYRFGSQAQGTATPESDVDLALLAHCPLSLAVLFDLQQQLAALLHKDVDLVDLRSASTVLRMQVVSTGECLVSANEQNREEFEARALSAYARLNEERRGILEDVRTRGSVYGR